MSLVTASVVHSFFNELFLQEGVFSDTALKALYRENPLDLR